MLERAAANTHLVSEPSPSIIDVVAACEWPKDISLPNPLRSFQMENQSGKCIVLSKSKCLLINCACVTVYMVANVHWFCMIRIRLVIAIELKSTGNRSMRKLQ